MREHVNVNGYTYDKLAYEMPFEGQDVVHEICSVREDGSEICTCGLVLEEGDNILQVLGHVDPATKRPVSTIVFRVPRQAHFHVICQDCAWRQIRPTLQLATACRRHHKCFFLGFHPKLNQLRTREDFLGAALDNTGWTVGATDPRAPRFLHRVAELAREQADGRMTRDEVHETLRKEFPVDDTPPAE